MKEIIKRKCKGCPIIMELDRQHLGKLYHSEKCKRLFNYHKNKLRIKKYSKSRKINIK